ncbi:MAG: hypothetical protein KA794_14010, partial [Candidatus Obscuribacter sp.]|nr:hypothetical protein [Candidatus Obscuribacter sp.]
VKSPSGLISTKSSQRVQYLAESRDEKCNCACAAVVRLQSPDWVWQRHKSYGKARRKQFFLAVPFFDFVSRYLSLFFDDLASYF